MATLGALIVELRANSLQFRTELEGARRSLGDVSRAHTAAGGAFQGTGRQINEATRLVRVFAGSILTEINPALGQMTSAMSGAGRVAAGLNPVLGVGVVVLTTAAATLAQYGRTLNQASARQADFNLAVRALDFGSIVAQVDAASKELERFNASLGGKFLDVLRQIGAAPGTTGAPNLFDRLFGKTPLEEFLKSSRESSAAAAWPQIQKATTEEYLKQLSAAEQLRHVEAERAESRGDFVAWLDVQRKITDDLSRQFTAEQVLVDLEARLATLRATARLGGALPGELELIEARQKQQTETLGARFLAGFGAIDRTVEQGRLRELIEARTVDRDRLTLLRDTVGLSEAELAARSREVIEASRLLEIAQANGDARKEDLANLRAALATSALVRQELEQGPVGAVFAGVTRNAASALEGLLDQTTTVEQAFRSMTISIRNSILENVVDKGIRAAHDALFKWLADLAEAGLLRGVLGAVLGAGFGAGAPTSGVGPGVAGPIGPPTQHGGVFTAPQFRLLGEAGPEAVIPLRGGAVPVRMLGAGAPGVIVNIFPPSGTTVEQRDSVGPGGEVVKNIIMRTIRQASQTGELDSVMGTYGLRRPGLAR